MVEAKTKGGPDPYRKGDLVKDEVSPVSAPNRVKFNENLSVDNIDDGPVNIDLLDESIDDANRYDMMMKTDPLFNTKLSFRGTKVDRCYPLHVEKETLVKNQLQTQDYVELDGKDLEINKGGNIISRKISNFNPKIGMPSPLNAPTGYFLMGEGGGEDPHSIIRLK